MCGICGVYSPTPQSSRVREMLTLLAHRGPDNASMETSTGVTFGHTRLSLLDPSERGNQPFKNEGALLVFNGEIYNFRELQASLKEKGISFSTGTDTEVLFHLLGEYGVEDTVRQLRGMFAFAYYDIRRQELTLARDRLGIKPLFFSHADDKVIFASELKAILLSGGSYELREYDVLRSAFGHLERSRRRTPFGNIEQVEPGSYITFRGTTRATTRYFRTSTLFDPSLYSTLRGMSDEEIDSSFREVLQRSVGSMLLADASVGAFVSGGLDSSVIAALIARGGKSAALYSLNIAGRYSEIESARILSRHLGLTLHEYEFLPHYFLRDWVNATYFYEAPIIMNQHAVPFGSIAKVAREMGEKAVLTGEGADELLLGYSPHIRARAREGLMQILSPLLKMVRGSRSIAAVSSYRSLPRELDDIYTGGDEREREDEYRAVTSSLSDRTDRVMHSWSLRLLDTTLQALLWRNDRMGMMHSVESRFPFLDEEVIRFCVSLPLKHKIALSRRGFDRRNPGLLGKAILRRSFEGMLPKGHTYLLKKPLPIHGMGDVQIEDGFFLGGFWERLLQVDSSQLKDLLASSSLSIKQRMAAIEVWGRLFVVKQSRGEVQEFVERWCRMRV